MRKVKVARVVQTPAVILVFMDDHQRHLLVKSPKTVVATQTKDIHTSRAAATLTSLLVLGKYLGSLYPSPAFINYMPSFH